LAYSIDATAQGEFQAPAIVFRESVDSQVDARKVESFARAKFPTHNCLAMNLSTGDALYLELHQAIVQEETVPGFHHAWQRLKTHRSSSVVTNDIFAGKSEGIAHLQSNGLRFDSSKPHLRAGKIRHNRDAAPDLFFGGADASYHLSVMFEFAMGEIQTGDIETSSYQPL
jgi:hypothetical protein